MLREVIVDDELVREAKQIGRHQTEADAVAAALQEYVTRRRQQAVIDLFGMVDYDSAYDYKA